MASGEHELVHRTVKCRRHTLSWAALRPHHIAGREDTGGGPKGSSPKDTPKS